MSGSFRFAPDIRWTYRVHEQILPALRRAKIPVRWTDLTVRHTGYVDQALRARKLDRDTRILSASWKSGPTSRLSCSTWARSPSSAQRWPEALGFLEAQSGRLGTDRFDRAQAVCPDRPRVPDDRETRRSAATCAEGLKLDPEDAELWFRKGVVHRHRGESTDAEQCWRRILTEVAPNDFAASTRVSTAT